MYLDGTMERFNTGIAVQQWFDFLQSSVKTLVNACGHIIGEFYSINKRVSRR
jgi:hypothetical protein